VTKKLKRYLFLFTIVFGAIGVYEQLKRPPADRSWHGKALGIVPYDFRPPNPQRFLDAYWNPDDPRVFTERDFGVGWAVNFHRVYRLTIGRQDYDGEPDRIGDA
jgi:hypothetical protein